MATPPTFSSGAILTAAQMNSVGLWLIKTQTVGSAVSSVSVTGAFSSDYENYRIIYSNGVGSATHFLGLNLGIGGTFTATNYFGGIGYINVGTGTWLVASDNGTVIANYCGGGGTGATTLDLQMNQPNVAKNTYWTGSAFQDPNGRFGTCSYAQLSTTQFTSFKITPSAGTLTGGTIYVYGYKGTV